MDSSNNNKGQQQQQAMDEAGKKGAKSNLDFLLPYHKVEALMRKTTAPSSDNGGNYNTGSGSNTYH